MDDVLTFGYDLFFLLIKFGSVGMVIVVIVYATVRAGSVAFFRSKMEHFRSTWETARRRNHHNGGN